MTKLEDDRLLSVKWLSLFQGLKTGMELDSLSNISTYCVFYFASLSLICYINHLGFFFVLKHGNGNEKVINSN